MPASTQYDAQITAAQKCLKYMSQDDWVTSGKLGSRDAVLVFRTNILNPKTRKLLLDQVTEEMDSRNEDRQLNSVESEMAHKTSISPIINETRLTKAVEEKTYVSVENLPTCKTFPKSLKISHELFSSCDTSMSSDGDETVQYNEKKTRIRQKKNSNVVQLQVDLNNEITYDSILPASNTEINTSEEDPEISSEGDNDCGVNMPAHHLQITYKFIQTETKLLRKIFNVHGLTEVQGESNFNLLWTGVHMKLDTLRNLAIYQRVNHFPRSYELTRKDRLYKNIERMQHLRGMKHFDIVPQSFILPLEYRDLIFAHNKLRGPWIVKPAASSRGRGIFIVNSPDQIPGDEQVLVSKYIVDPLCIDGHKCDLRVYVLVTSFDPLIIYLYEEGIVRLATVRYDRHTDNLWNPCMHLCNYSINKYHSDYIRSSDAQDEDVGHKWTLSALLRHLKLQGCDTHLLMLNIEDLIIKAVLASAQTIISACRMFVPNVNNCFELYGFDILIDNTLKPWLLEVNLSPSMGVDSPLDTKVKACLITDLLTCVGIPAFSPQMRSHYDNKSTRLRSSSFQRQVDIAESNSAIRSSKTKKKTFSMLQLTQEEQRILRSARLQYTRRGGFVRIFPTDDTMQRYGHFLDSANGIPLSTPNVQGQSFQSLVTQHNYNQMLHSNLYCPGGSLYMKDDNSQENRIRQYERALETDSEIPFLKKQIVEKCEEEGRRLRKQILKKIGSGSTLTLFQARQTFSFYLESVLRRLTQDPKDSHEKIILKFLNKYGGGVKPPVLFRNTQNISKARSAMVAKLLGDFLEIYKRDTEAYIDSFDHFGMIPTSAYSLFLMHAQESDLEAVLTHHTNVTGIMPYLYNRSGTSVPATPPIPSGLHGFLRALPAMVTHFGFTRDVSKYDGYFKS